MGSENGAGKILYIRADQNTEVKEPCVSVGDIACFVQMSTSWRR